MLLLFAKEGVAQITPIDKRITDEKMKLAEIRRGNINAEWIGRGGCDVCGGTGFYHMTVEQWYRAIAIEVEKQKGILAPIQVFYDFRPNGIQVQCTCMGQEIGHLARSVTATIHVYERNRRWIELALGSAYLGKTLAMFNWPRPENETAFSAWLNDPKKSMYIHGISGKGKTHLLSGIAQHFADRDLVVIQYAELSGVIRDLNMPGRTTFIDSLFRTGLLLIDNLGGIETDTERTVLESIITYRNTNGKATVYTAEKSAGKILPPGGTMDAVMKNTITINLDL